MLQSANITLALTILLFSLTALSQDTSYSESNISINSFVEGTLLTPNNPNSTLAIIIAGSGPTDRNGNQNFIKGNTLKKLALALGKQQICSFRYDKRIIKQLKEGKLDFDISFDDFITDAISVISYFKNNNSYSKIFVIGHSQGSLVGMIASNDLVNGFISLSGAGQTIDNILLEQIKTTAPMYFEASEKVLKSLKQGKTTNDYPLELSNVFSKDLQPFMISWINHNPQDAIKKLQMPVLIINGTNDIQVSVNEAQLLKKAAPNATLKLIENMNHVLVIMKSSDRLENMKSYNESSRKLSEELVNQITQFINSN